MSSNKSNFFIWKSAKKTCERYPNLSKEEEEKSKNMAVNNTKIYQKMKNKSWLCTEKNVTKWEKTPYYNYNKLFSSIIYSLWLDSITRFS